MCGDTLNLVREIVSQKSSVLKISQMMAMIEHKKFWK